MKTIMILEDDLVIQRLYKRILGGSYSLLVVGTVAEAVAALDATRPDLFLSDMKVPDGLGTTAVINCKHKYPDVPVIVASGTMEDLGEMKVTRTIEKPFSPDALSRLIEEVI